MMQRDEYIQKLKTQLDEWNAEMAKWEAKAASAQADARPEYERQLETFRRQRDEGLEQMRKLQAAAGNAWQEFARGTEEAWKKMQESFEKARSHWYK